MGLGCTLPCRGCCRLHHKGHTPKQRFFNAHSPAGAARLPAAAPPADRLQPLCCLAPCQRRQPRTAAGAACRRRCRGGDGHGCGGLAEQPVCVQSSAAAAAAGRRAAATAAAAAAAGAPAAAQLDAGAGPACRQRRQPEQRGQPAQQPTQWRGGGGLWLPLPGLRPPGVHPGGGPALRLGMLLQPGCLCSLSLPAWPSALKLALAAAACPHCKGGCLPDSLAGRAEQQRRDVHCRPRLPGRLPGSSCGGEQQRGRPRRAQRLQRCRHGRRRRNGGGPGAARLGGGQSGALACLCPRLVALLCSSSCAFMLGTSGAAEAGAV